MLSSAALSFLLGLRHGCDADHLAAIDGLTRFNLVRHRRFAPYCGALFSAGHGLVISLAATTLAFMASAWTAPTWLESTGKIISAGILLLLGACNLTSAMRHRQDGRPNHALVGMRSGLFAFALRSSRPWQIMLVGALFALSFDALGLAVLFAAGAATLGGVVLAAALSGVFAGGMVIVDTANGLWLARLARRSDRSGNAAARMMTLSIGLISLVLGAAIASSCVWISFDRWLDRHELEVSALLVLTVLFVYLFGRTQARQSV